MTFFKKLLNPYDKEYMKIAMLKHEETFRKQVYELHRLYRIQKILMSDHIAKNRQNNQPEIRQCVGLERPVAELNIAEEAGNRCRVSEIEDGQRDLELTLGPRSYNQWKIKAAEPGLLSDSGPRFSSSFSNGSSHVEGTLSLTRDDQLLNQQKRPGMEKPVSNQDRLNHPPWLFQALSLNLT